MKNIFKKDLRTYIQQILPYLKNKYFITAFMFFIWMLFFDRNDIISQVKLSLQLEELRDEKIFYLTAIEEINEINKELFTDEESLEKFAREKYLMKKDDEDIFIIVREDPNR